MLHLIYEYTLISYIVIVVILTIIHDKKAKRSRTGETNHSTCKH